MAFVVARDLRREGLRVVLHCGGGSFKSQFKRADACGARFAIVLGEEEAARGVATVKHLTGERMGEQTTLALDAVAACVRAN